LCVSAVRGRLLGPGPRDPVWAHAVSEMRGDAARTEDGEDRRNRAPPARVGCGDIAALSRRGAPRRATTRGAETA